VSGLPSGERDVLRAELADLRRRVDQLSGWLQGQGEHLGGVDARVAALEPRANEGATLAQQFATAPFVAASLPLEAFDAGPAGRVVGYRDQVEPIAPQDAYAYFTDVFRGDAERIADLQRAYLPLLAGRAPVLDAGCGRGELLDLLRDAGIPAEGVDLDAGMAQRCRARGHTVAVGDAVEHLGGLGDGALGAVVSCQVVEHLPPAALERLLAEAARVLRPGGLLIAETVNPHAMPSFHTFWVDPTHVAPLFPETLLALCRIAGFPAAYVMHPGGSGDATADRSVVGAYAVVATAP
jgi:O-antigen chain-terminating methyltransferase